MGGRLLQWFSDVHEQAENTQELPLHSTVLSIIHTKEQKIIVALQKP